MDTKQTIITESIRQFSQNGYHGVSLDTILKATSLSKGAFFYHFKSKEELAIHCIQTYTTEVIAYLRTMTSTHDDPKQKIIAWIKTLGQLIKKQQYTGLLVTTLANETASIPAITNAIKASYKEQTGRFIEQLMLLKTQKRTHTNIEQTASFFVTHSEGIITRATVSKNSQDLDSDITFLGTLIEAMIS